MQQVQVTKVHMPVTKAILDALGLTTELR